MLKGKWIYASSLPLLLQYNEGKNEDCVPVSMYLYGMKRNQTCLPLFLVNGRLSDVASVMMVMAI